MLKMSTSDHMPLFLQLHSNCMFKNEADLGLRIYVIRKVSAGVFFNHVGMKEELLIYWKKWCDVVLS